MKVIIKPFNIEGAKAGATVITRSGKPVKILTCEARMDTPIVALVDLGNKERVFTYFFNGYFYYDKESTDDLVIKEIKFEEGDFVAFSDDVNNPIFGVVGFFFGVSRIYV